MRPAASHLREDESGSAPAEFVLVGGLLTLLTLAVLQIGLAVYVRNVVHDAAVEGAHYAALADSDRARGVDRARIVIERAVGTQYADDITASYTSTGGVPSVTVTVRTVLPLVGLVGLPAAMEVSASAPVESLP